MRSAAGLCALALCLAVGCADPVAPGPIEGTTVVVRNELVSPVRLQINGVDVGRVEARSQRAILRGALDEVHVRWSMEMPLVDGRGIGDSMSASFPTKTAGDGETVSFDIDNVIFDGTSNVTYYAPLIGNATSAPIVVGVNMDSPREIRLGLIPPGTSARFIGYYRAAPGSGVRAYRPETAYGPLLYIERAFGHAFGLADIATGSGELPLDFNADPP